MSLKKLGLIIASVGALNVLSPLALADHHECSCSEKCHAACKEKKSENCSCKCGCKETGVCAHGKCSEHGDHSHGKETGKAKGASKAK